MHARNAALAAAVLACAAAVALAAGNAPRSDVAWRCRVCEDAVQSWHDQFPCAGGFLDWGDAHSVNIPGCQGPHFKCNSLGGKMRDACLSMEQEFSFSNGAMAKKIWETMMTEGDPYQTCIDLKKCPAERNMDDKEQWSDCLATFRNESLGHRPYTKEYAENCEEPCYLCIWLVKFWPLFGETCRPEGAELSQAVPLPNDVQPGQAALLEAGARLRRALPSAADAAAAALDPRAGAAVEQRFAEASQRAGAMARASARARALAYERAMAEAREAAEDEKAAAGSPKPEQAQTELQTGLTLPKECFARWKEIERTPRVRYFVSWKKYVNVLSNNLDRLDGRMWDANVVCKCLGHCEVSRFEDLGLIEACRYGDAEEQMMDYLFRQEGKIPQFKEA